MSAEIEAFRAELRAAGQPWHRRGMWSVGAGIVLMALAQTIGQAAPIAPYFFPSLILALILMVSGWIMLVVAILRRRRWARGHQLVMPGMSDLEQGASGNP